MSAPLHKVLRGIADSNFAGLQAEQREALREAAAELEGHNEAFAQVVADKTDLQAKLDQSRRNHQSTLDLVAKWGDLLRELKFARPLMLYGDEWIVRIKRALCEIA
jgi:hypothetical protein